MKKLTRIMNLIFRLPEAEELAVQELAEARRSLLEAQSSMEYTAAMVEYSTKRVSRLTKLVGAQTVKQ